MSMKVSPSSEENHTEPLTVIEEGRAGATPTLVREFPVAATTGTLRFYNSKPSERFYAMGERVFGREIRSLTKVYIVNPYED